MKIQAPNPSEEAQRRGVNVAVIYPETRTRYGLSMFNPQGGSASGRTGSRSAMLLAAREQHAVTIYEENAAGDVVQAWELGRGAAAKLPVEKLASDWHRKDEAR